MEEQQRRAAAILLDLELLASDVDFEVAHRWWLLRARPTDALRYRSDADHSTTAHRAIAKDSSRTETVFRDMPRSGGASSATGVSPVMSGVSRQRKRATHDLASPPADQQC